MAVCPHGKVQRVKGVVLRSVHTKFPHLPAHLSSWQAHLNHYHTFHYVSSLEPQVLKNGRPGIKVLHSRFVSTEHHPSHSPTTSAPKAFPYQPLLQDGSIRILVLHAALEGKNYDDEVRVSIQIGHPDRDSYEALSYVWNDPYARNHPESKSSTILLEHGGTKQRINVTPNLFLALRRLRFQHSPRFLWVDALCINQDNVQEKNQQVPMMGSIYGKAATVLVWLGEEDMWTKRAMETVSQWADIYKSERKLLQGESYQPNLLRKLREHGTFAYDQAYIEALTRRAWFSRSWTFQEACLSRSTEMICGGYSCTWSTFHDACSAVIHAGQRHYIFEENSNIKTIYDYSHSKKESSETGLNSQDEQYQLSNLVHRTRMYECSNPRDKIYSLLSVASPMVDKKNSIRPNYGLSVVEVYSDFTRKIIQDNRDLRLLSLVKRARRDAQLKSLAHQRGITPTPGLPSWVPDLRDHDCTEYLAENQNIRIDTQYNYRTRFPQPFSLQYNEAPPKYNVNLDNSSSLNETFFFEVGDDLKLGLYGKHMDTVDRVFLLTGLTDDPYVRLSTEKDLEKLTLESSASSSSPDTTESNVEPPFDWLVYFNRFRFLEDQTYEPTREDMLVAILRTCSADLLPISSRMPLFYKRIYFPRHFDWYYWQNWRALERKYKFGSSQSSEYVTQMSSQLMEIARAVSARVIRAVQGGIISQKDWNSFDLGALRKPYKVYRLYEWLLKVENGQGRDFTAQNFWKVIFAASIMQGVLNVWYKDHLDAPIKFWFYKFQDFIGYTIPIEPKPLFWCTVVAILALLSKSLTKNIKPGESDPTISATMASLQSSSEGANWEWEIAREVQNAINRAAWNRVFYITKSGYIGLGPIGTRRGDEVYSLLGAQVPFILRRCAKNVEEDTTRNMEEYNEFQLLGESYVHGLMDGEFWIRTVRLSGGTFQHMKEKSEPVVLV